MMCIHPFSHDSTGARRAMEFAPSFPRPFLDPKNKAAPKTVRRKPLRCSLAFPVARFVWTHQGVRSENGGLEERGLMKTPSMTRRDFVRMGAGAAVAAA